MLYGVYLQDIWQINEQFTVTAGIRYDGVSGIVNNNMPSPRINVLYQPDKNTALHAGFARYFQTPDFQTISPRSFADFQNTTAPVATGWTDAISGEGLLLERRRPAPFRASFDRSGKRLLSSLTGSDRSGAIRLCADFSALQLYQWTDIRLRNQRHFRLGKPDCARQLHLLGGAGE